MSVLNWSKYISNYLNTVLHCLMSKKRVYAFKIKLNYIIADERQVHTT